MMRTSQGKSHVDMYFKVLIKSDGVTIAEKPSVFNQQFTRFLH
jgi:hypothetical protein